MKRYLLIQLNKTNSVTIASFDNEVIAIAMLHSHSPDIPLTVMDSTTAGVLASNYTKHRQWLLENDELEHKNQHYLDLEKEVDELENKHTQLLESIKQLTERESTLITPWLITLNCHNLGSPWLQPNVNAYGYSHVIRGLIPLEPITARLAVV